MRILYTHYLNDDNHPAARMVNAIAHELEDLGHDLVAKGATLAGCIGAYGTALQLGIRLGHHLIQSRRFDDSEALQSQSTQKLVVGGSGREGPVAAQIDGALHTRVEHHLPPGHAGHGTGHGFNLGVDKVQRNRRVLRKLLRAIRFCLREGRRTDAENSQQTGNTQPLNNLKWGEGMSHAVSPG